MAVISDIIARVRLELGDLAEDFVVPVPGGSTVIELGVRNVISGSLTVTVAMPAEPGVVVDPSRYVLSPRTGVVTLLDYPDPLATVTVIGQHFPMFDDSEITTFIDEAAIHHLHDREVTTRTRTSSGHIQYDHVKMTIANMPEVEELPLAILATINALWNVLTDAATDIDVVTAEGTHIRRSERYEQVTGLIAQLTTRYRDICEQYNIGLYRIEVRQLRRVSLSTGRLVPIFRPREYDESGPESYPKRLLPSVPGVYDEDESGIPSPWFGPYGY